MPSVRIKGEWESFESLLKRFKRSVEKANTLTDIRKHEFYEKPSELKKRAKMVAKKRKRTQ